MQSTITLYRSALVASLFALAGCGAATEEFMLEGETALPDVEVQLDPAATGASELGVARQALGNLCEDVQIEVTNSREEPNGARPDIKVTALEFYNLTNGKYEKETVTNRVISYGSDYTFVRSLEGADGDEISSWRVYYKHDLGNGWSSEVYEYVNTTNIDCWDGMPVDLTVYF